MDKLEKHIKQKLEQRTLEPSHDTWGKIEFQLDDVKQKSYKKWYAVAAVFLGAILTLSLLLNSSDPIQQDKLVDTKTETEQPIIDKSEVVFEHQQQTEQNKKEENVIGGKDGDFNDKTLKENGSKIKTANQNNGGKSSQLAFEKNTAKTIQVFDSIKIERQAIDTKIESILAQVNAMEENAIYVTDAEIDSLLMTAQRELLTDKVLQQTGSVDAIALLNEVELELYDDQRNLLFKRLKEGFFKLRTAVANKN